MPDQPLRDVFLRLITDGASILSLNALQEDELTFSNDEGETICAEWDQCIAQLIEEQGATIGYTLAATIRANGATANNIRIRSYILANPGTLVGATMLSNSTLSAPNVAAPAGILISETSIGVIPSSVLHSPIIFAVTAQALTGNVVGIRAIGISLGAMQFA